MRDPVSCDDAHKLSAAGSLRSIHRLPPPAWRAHGDVLNGMQRVRCVAGRGAHTSKGAGAPCTRQVVTLWWCMELELMACAVRVLRCGAVRAHAERPRLP